MMAKEIERADITQVLKFEKYLPQSFLGRAITFASCKPFGSIYGQLLGLRKPARYIGEEYNIRKTSDEEFKQARFRFAHAFPGVYEMGMGYGGMHLFYELFNNREESISKGYLLERVFLPDTDMQALMLKKHVPLFTLEGKRPIRCFDAIGFSFTYEAGYTNMLRMLKLAGIPIWQKDRKDEPLIIAGGGCMFNPEPIAEFCDAIAIGDGEELILEVAETLAELRGAPRLKKLIELSKIDGIYIPSFYRVIYDDTGRFLRVEPRQDIQKGFMPRAQIVKRLLMDFGSSEPNLNPVISYIEHWGSGTAIEVMRGCPQRCRFCQAGYIYLPTRPRNPTKSAELAIKLAENTGEEQISLQSLSTLDHPGVLKMIESCKEFFDKHMISIGLPSSRMDSLSRKLAEITRRPRESSLTFAPEAGSQKLREAINKSVTSADIEQTFKFSMEAGWHKFKLYFMIGFPGETYEDVQQIAEIIKLAKRLSRKISARKPIINVSVNVFIPKPHTPLQWAPLAGREDIVNKHKLLKRELNKLKGVKLSYSSYEEAFVETLLSRGDRRVSRVLALAEEYDLIMQDDSAYFDFERWQKAWRNANYPAYDDVHRKRNFHDPLPWDHINSMVFKSFLWSEYEKYFKCEQTPSCYQKCLSCGLPCASAERDYRQEMVPTSFD